MATEDRNGCLHGEKDGKFVSKDKTESKAYDSKDDFSELKKGIETGAKSGALNPNSKEAQKHGKLMYETFRKIKSDVPKIATNTGYSIEQIQKIKNYIFFNDEFDEDFDQAQTWDRLRKGIPIEADFIFIKHELLEIEYRKQGYSYDEAHELTQKKYNYHKAITEYNNAILKKERSNPI